MDELLFMSSVLIVQDIILSLSLSLSLSLHTPSCQYIPNELAIDNNLSIMS